MDPMEIKQQNITVPETKAKKKISLGWIAAFAALGLLLLLMGLGLRRAQERGTPKAIGSEMPDFSLTSFDGQSNKLSDLRGKVVLINFWASWCKPCVQEAADMERAWRLYQPGGEVVFLGIDWTDTEPKALAYLEKFGITYPNGPDLGTRISQAYRTTGVPETYILDRDGRLAYVKLSPFNSLAEIQAAIDPLLEK